MSYLIYGGVDTRTLGVEVFPIDVDSTPEREYDTYQIPGRNGDLHMSRKRMGNREQGYYALLPTNGADGVRELVNKLAQFKGYQRLEDGINTDEFYLAVYRAAAEPVLPRNRDMAKVQIIFDRMPQRFLKSGETVKTYTSDGTITNPTLCASQPLIRVYGTGIVGVGTAYITITSADGYTDIDCMAMECYKGAVSRNATVIFSTGDYPTLPPGDSGVTLSGGITKVEITPRWWRK